jgi:hypothetical protein
VTAKRIGCFLLTWLFSMPCLAADNLYAVFSLGYADFEVAQQESSGMGYKLAFGYQFDPQWYVEAGYQQLIHDELFITSLPSAADINSSENRQQGDALFVSFLGKATGSIGELFYRIGALKTDIRGQSLLSGEGNCELGQGSTISIVDFGTATLCDYDESGIAGVMGIGFDYFISARAMVRAEIEYIKGQDNLSVTAAFVGLRYNF